MGESLPGSSAFSPGKWGPFHLPLMGLGQGIKKMKAGAGTNLFLGHLALRGETDTVKEEDKETHS